MTPETRRCLDACGDLTVIVMTVGLAIALMSGTVGIVVWVCRWMLAVVRGGCL